MVGCHRTNRSCGKSTPPHLDLRLAVPTVTPSTVAIDVDSVIESVKPDADPPPPNVVVAFAPPPSMSVAWV